MTQIEVVFLGTTAGVPTKKRNHASVFLKYQSEQEYHCLFDCGEGTQRQMLFAGVNFMRISDIFITHWHADHFAGLLGLMETMNLEGRKEALNIYAPEAEKFVDILLSMGYSTKDFDVVPKDVWHEGIEKQTLLDEAEFRITAMPMKHSIPAVAYAFEEKDRVKIDREKAKKLGLPEKHKIYRDIKEKGSAVFQGKEITFEDISFMEKGKKVVYSGDTTVNKNMLRLAENADMLIHDSTFFGEEEEEEKNYRHAGFEDAIGLAKQARVKQLVLTHISRRYQNEQLLKDKISDFRNVRIADDLMRIVVK
ncbi:MAG: ribonuclease Z [Candidatus Aenigmarchaeota archaeon]|nr:ribonuclease Z [Candidatus Aenigmarchaeota archaeon]